MQFKFSLGAMIRNDVEHPWKNAKRAIDDDTSIIYAVFNRGLFCENMLRRIRRCVRILEFSWSANIRAICGKKDRVKVTHYTVFLSLNSVCPFTSQETPNEIRAIDSNTSTGHTLERNVFVRNAM